MNEQKQEFELRHYLTILRRRIAIVLLVPAVTVFVAVVLDFSATRIYAASADVVVTNQQQQSVFPNSQVIAPADPAREIDTQVQLVQSRAVDRAVRRKLGSKAADVHSVSASGVGLTDVIRVTVESPSASVARRSADLYAQVYVDTRRKQAVDSLIAAGSELQKKLTDLQSQLNGVPAGAQRDALVAQYELFKQRVDQLQVDASLQQGGAQVVDTAVTPTSPVKPKPLRDIALALVLGLFIGIALAFLAEYLDDRTHTAEDVARYGDGLTVLAEIPAVAVRDSRSSQVVAKSTQVVALEDPNSLPAEAYRSLRTSLEIIGLRRAVKTLLVTSPTASEGKTTTVANLGVTMARAGRRVVLVDFDLRRPELERFFGVETALGVTSVLVGDSSLSEALHVVEIAPGVPPVQILASGRVPPNPSELLGAERVAELLESLQETADIVILDSPPLLPVTDALVLSGRVDGVLLVVGADSTRRRPLRRAIDLLRQSDAPLLGAVLNGTSLGRGRAYGYGYGPRRDEIPARESGRPPAESAQPSQRRVPRRRSAPTRGGAQRQVPRT